MIIVIFRRSKYERTLQSGQSAGFLHATKKAPDALTRLTGAPLRHSPTLSLGLLLLSLGLTALPAQADDACDAPLHRWQSREAVRQMAAAQGWQIERLKIDDGCYDIRFSDAQGRRFKAKIDPETLKVLKLKQDDHKRARERHDQGAAQQARPAHADSAGMPASLPLSIPGGAARSEMA